MTLAAPLYADLKGLPPLLIQVGNHETLLDDSNRIAARARAAGVKVILEVWPEMIHVWQMFASFLPEAQEAIEAIGKVHPRPHQLATSKTQEDYSMASPQLKMAIDAMKSMQKTPPPTLAEQDAGLESG